MKEEFIKFLKDHKAYSKFVREFKNSNFNENFDNYFETIKEISILSACFKWSKTKDSHYFWSNLNIKWLDYLEKVKKENDL